jgi:hypothetical protein
MTAPESDASSVLSSQVEPASRLDTSTVEGGEEKPLESHEVIELKTFSERRAWIEDKIKVWERPIIRIPAHLYIF